MPKLKRIFECKETNQSCESIRIDPQHIQKGVLHVNRYNIQRDNISSFMKMVVLCLGKKLVVLCKINYVQVGLNYMVFSTSGVILYVGYGAANRAANKASNQEAIVLPNIYIKMNYKKGLFMFRTCSSIL